MRGQSVSESRRYRSVYSGIMEDYKSIEQSKVSEEMTSANAAGASGSPCVESTTGQDTVVVGDISRSSSEHTIASSVQSLRRRGDESTATWMEFGTWLEALHVPPTGDTLEEEGSSVEVHVETNVSQQNDCTVRRDSPIIHKDCRMESSLLAGGPGRGLQEMSVMLGVPGVPAVNCPIVPTKSIANIMNVLYEPLVTVDVGVLTRTLQSPMLLQPREYARRGRLSLYILPDDSLSLVFEGEIEDMNKMRMGTLCDSMSTVEDVFCVDVQASTWEELARFPPWREQSDKPIVTVHMLKGDKSGKSFYVMAGEGTDPGPPLTLKNQENFAEFASRARKREACEGRRYYFWMTGSDIEEDIHNLGKMKSYIKHPPTLARIACVSQTVLDNLASWANQIDRVQRDNSTQGSTPVITNPFDAIGAVLSRQIATMSTQYSFLNSEGPCIESCTTATANASAVFTDYQFGILCPCNISVSFAFVLRGRVCSPGTDEECIQGMSQIASDIGQHFCRDVAKESVEKIGKIRVQEWTCEDVVQKTRQQRLKAKAARQKKRDKERGYLALVAAGDMIQKAVASANLGRKLQRDDIIEQSHHEVKEDGPSPSDTSDEGIVDDASSPKSESPDLGVVDSPGTSQNVDIETRKISIHDLNKLFGK